MHVTSTVNSSDKSFLPETVLDSRKRFFNFLYLVPLLELPFLCSGPTSENGLQIQSYRGKNGLVARVSFPKKFQAFPGIINGGIVNTAFDCHGNWTAAIALMDKALLPRPPFTLSSGLQVGHHITSHHITSHHITSHHITSHHITSHHITSHHITSHHPPG